MHTFIYNPFNEGWRTFTIGDMRFESSFDGSIKVDGINNDYNYKENESDWESKELSEFLNKFVLI